MNDLLPNAPREFQFKGEEIALEMNREIGMREHVYPGRVAAGKMTPQDAARKIALAKCALKIIQAHALGKVFKEPA